MKARIPRTVLGKALKTITPAVHKGGGLPVLVGVRIDATSGGLTLTATNGELAIDTSVEADVGDPGVVITPAGHLARLVASLAGDTVELTLNDADLTVTCGDTTADLKTLPAEEWPRLIANEGTPVTLNTAECMRIAAALPMASTDPNPSKRKLHCVHLAGQRISVSDSYRAAIVGVEADLPDVLIPAATVAMILRQADAIDIVADERSVTILTADHATSWRLPLVVEDYPDIEKHLMRTESPHSLRFDSVALRDALVRCDAFSDKDIRTVTLTPDGDTVTLSMTQDHGTITEAVPLLAGDFPRPLTYNAGFLASVVEAAAGEQVTLELVDEMKPVIVRGTRIALLLMPVRSGVKA